MDYLCLLARLVQFTGMPEEFLTNMQSASIYGQDGFIMQSQRGLAEREAQASLGAAKLPTTMSASE